MPIGGAGGGSVDLSAKICAIDVLVEIMAQEPNNRITRQKTRTRQDLARPEIPTAQRSAAFGLAQPPLNFRFCGAPACGQLQHSPASRQRDCALPFPFPEK